MLRHKLAPTPVPEGCTHGKRLRHRRGKVGTGGIVCQAGILGWGLPKDCKGRQALDRRKGNAAARPVLNGQLPALGRRPHQGQA